MPDADQKPSGTPIWLWPLIAVLAIVAIGLYYWNGQRATTAPPVAQTPPATPAPSAVAQSPPATPAPSPLAQTPAPSPLAQTPPATPVPTPDAQAAAVAPATEPPRLELNYEGGVAHVTGAVHDEGAKVSILDALKSVFGADKVQGDITVDANRDPAPWLAKFSDALASLKTGGVEAVFDGDSVNVGGAIGDADRDRIIVALKGALGDSLSFGVLRDHAADPASANGKATTELTSLQSGFAPKDLIATLNKSIVNFPSDSAEVPASMDAFLRSAATDLKQLRAGHVIEIAGYTDNTGDPALNVALSQKRAEAVRDALIKDGADPAMLIAKGYGSVDPIASNDTPEGRLRNRRIEYRVVKTP